MEAKNGEVKVEQVSPTIPVQEVDIQAVASSIKKLRQLRAVVADLKGRSKDDEVKLLATAILVVIDTGLPNNYEEILSIAEKASAEATTTK